MVKATTNGKTPFPCEWMPIVPIPIEEKPDVSGCSCFCCERGIQYVYPLSVKSSFLVQIDFHLWSTTGLNCWISPVFIIYCVLPLSCVVKGKTKLIPCKDTIYRWFKDVYWSVSKAVFPLHGAARLDSIYLYGFPLWTWYLVHFCDISLQLQVQSLYCRVNWSRGPQQRRTTDDILRILPDPAYLSGSH